MASENNGAFIRNIAEVPWREFPNHFGGALSKPLIMPETAGSRHIDYRISMYQPMAHVARHSHRVQEQIYHVLEGEGHVGRSQESEVGCRMSDVAMRLIYPLLTPVVTGCWAAWFWNWTHTSPTRQFEVAHFAAFTRQGGCLGLGRRCEVRHVASAGAS